MDLKLDASRKAFAKMGILLFDDTFPAGANQELLLSFEKGLITPNEFRYRIRSLASVPPADYEIDNAWNSMLGGMPQERWNLLTELKEHFRTFLLSNTNAIHTAYYFSLLQLKQGSSKFQHLFEKLYFSFELGMRKPDEDIFLHVISDAGLNPTETLFVDDNFDNIRTAKKLGFQICHIHKYISINEALWLLPDQPNHHSL